MARPTIQREWSDKALVLVDEIAHFSIGGNAAAIHLEKHAAVGVDKINNLSGLFILILSVNSSGVLNEPALK